MTTLDAGFEDALREDLLDEAESAVADHARELEREASDRFQSYAAREAYDISHLWRDTSVSRVRRTNTRVSARVSWPALTALFEYGVDPFVLEGNPTLAFEWLAPPAGTRPPGAPSFVVADSVNWGSVTGGISEARAIRTALQVVEQSMRGE